MSALNAGPASVCSACGLELSNGLELCPHHPVAFASSWASSNRLQCDFFHRRLIEGRKVPRRTPKPVLKIRTAAR